MLRFANENDPGYTAVSEYALRYWVERWEVQSVVGYLWIGNEDSCSYASEEYGGVLTEVWQAYVFCTPKDYYHFKTAKELFNSTLTETQEEWGYMKARQARDAYIAKHGHGIYNGIGIGKHEGNYITLYTFTEKERFRRFTKHG